MGLVSAMYINVSGDCFFVVTPAFMTSLGSRALACDARFCTWTEAISALTPSPKVTSSA